jgi:hypothetical protein
VANTIARPIFRIFDYSKAPEFYVYWLGFKIDWEDKPEKASVYLQISLDDIVLHLTEHHGDCSAGARVHIENFPRLKEYHKMLLDKNYQFNRPGIGVTPWDSKTYCMEVIDPFGNRLTFTGN